MKKIKSRVLFVRLGDNTNQKSSKTLRLHEKKCPAKVIYFFSFVTDYKYEKKLSKQTPRCIQKMKQKKCNNEKVLCVIKQWWFMWKVVINAVFCAEGKSSASLTSSTSSQPLDCGWDIFMNYLKVINCDVNYLI